MLQWKLSAEEIHKAARASLIRAPGPNKIQNFWF